MVTQIASAASMLFEPVALTALLVGVVVGILIGVMPGLGPTIAIALAIPFTLNMPLAPSIALLMGLYCASIYGGAITAILLNVPGTPASAATCLDGYAMARRGDGDLAIGIATMASAIGGMFSVVVLALVAPVLAQFALRFGPLELFLVGLFALCCVVVIERKALVKAVAAALIGVTIAAVGQDPVSGAMRLTFGWFPLSAGVPLVPLLVGMFAISEVMVRMAAVGTAKAEVVNSVGFRLPAMAYWRRGAPLLLKSSMIGTAIGILPGAGPTAASFIGYSEAKRTARDPDAFGKGEPDGVLAPEAANNAVTGGALVPSLSLGIPGDPITAIMLAALVLQGVTPGPRLYTEHFDIVLVVLMALFVANIGVLVFGALGSHLWTRVLRIPEPLLIIGVVVLATMGVYATNNSETDLYVMVGAGFLGCLLRAYGFPLAPLIIGFVLGPMVEVNMRQAMIVYAGNWSVLIERPIAGGLLAMTVLVIVYPWLMGRLFGGKAKTPGA